MVEPLQLQLRDEVSATLRNLHGAIRILSADVAGLSKNLRESGQAGRQSFHDMEQQSRRSEEAVRRLSREVGVLGNFFKGLGATLAGIGLVRLLENAAGGLIRMGQAGVHMHNLMQTTRLTQRTLLELEQGFNRLGSSSEEAQSILSGLGEKLAEFQQMGMRADWAQQLARTTRGAGEWLRRLQQELQRGGAEAGTRYIIESLSRQSDAASRAMTRALGLPLSARELQQVMRSNIPVTEANIRKQLEFNDKLVTFNWTLRNVQATLGNALLPILNDLGAWLITKSPEIEKAAKSFAKWIENPQNWQPLATSLKNIAGSIGEMLPNLEKAVAAFGEWSKDPKNYEKLGEDIKGIAAGMSSISSAITAIGTAWNALPGPLKGALLGAWAGRKVGGVPGAALGAVAGAVAGTDFEQALREGGREKAEPEAVLDELEQKRREAEEKRKAEGLTGRSWEEFQAAREQDRIRRQQIEGQERKAFEEPAFGPGQSGAGWLWDRFFGKGNRASPMSFQGADPTVTDPLRRISFQADESIREEQEGNVLLTNIRDILFRAFEVKVQPPGGPGATGTIPAAYYPGATGGFGPGVGAGGRFGGLTIPAPGGAPITVPRQPLGPGGGPAAPGPAAPGPAAPGPAGPGPAGPGPTGAALGKGVAPGYVVPRGEVEAYIRQAAIARGIDPETALTVARREGLGDWQSSVPRQGKGAEGGREASWGPYQLYTGGGLGNEFQRQTGLDPRDPRTWKQNIDFALNQVVKGGWAPWYGARAAGITGRMGVGQGAKQVAVSAGSGDPAPTPRGGQDPGAGGAGGGGRMTSGRSLQGVDSRLPAIMAAAARHLPEGYTIRATSGLRSGGGGFHPRGVATDWEIVDPQGKPIRNRGEDVTGLYSTLARGAYAEQRAQFPELTGKFAWGGAFGTSSRNPNEPDLMHFDLGGERGRLARYRRESLGQLPAPIRDEGQPSRVVAPRAVPQGYEPFLGGRSIQPAEELNRQLAVDTERRKLGTADLNVKVEAPRSTKVDADADGVFEKINVERTPPMAKGGAKGGAQLGFSDWSYE